MQEIKAQIFSTLTGYAYVLVGVFDRLCASITHIPDLKHPPFEHANDGFR